MMLSSPSTAGTSRKVLKRINRLENKVSTLRKKTQLNDRNGFHYGPIDDWQVVSFDFCLHGDDAVWVGTDVNDLSVLGCTEGPYPSLSQQQEQLLEQRNEATAPRGLR